MLTKVLAAIASFITGAGAVAHIVWWQLSHNFLNVSCSNIIYAAHHLQTCATWNRACGIVMGIDLPLIILGLFGTIGFGIWAASHMTFQDQSDPTNGHAGS